VFSLDDMDTSSSKDEDSSSELSTFLLFVSS
jgi:hypothetical protein